MATQSDVLTIDAARKRFGNVTALDGYLKVFWRNAPIVALWPQLLVLTGLTALFLGVARTLARRWETA